MLRFVVAIALCAIFARFCGAQCPDEDPNLVPWDPPADENQDVVIDNQRLLFTGNLLNLRTITIQNGGKLVVRDDGTPRRIHIRHMLITSDGEFTVGSQTCPFQSRLDIMLRGRSDATDIAEVPIFGRKFIGVAPTGRIVIHGTAKLSWTYLQTTVNAGETDRIVDLTDTPFNWLPGDRVVIASSDYDMNHAEEFVIGECPECSERQVKLEGTAEYTHIGTFSANGVDIRAEIGILTHNIKIYGEMESACYGSNFCEYFDYDTYGGHIQMLAGFRQADFQGVELFHMGQQLLGKYPIHYHVVGAVYGAFVRGISVHHCFSRCVTLHASEGLTVRDVVGYDTLGHCFFLEDGNEQNNQLIHNLGLVTKPGTLLPSDRDKNMCETMLDSVYPGYIPNAELDCMGASTFWIAHPNNTFRNNSAAGSVSNGFHFVFHRVPTGPSAGTLPAFHGERSTIPIFVGNRAHSNVDNGLLIDRGVKVDQASEEDPREFLALIDTARYMPHVNRDPLQPRSPAYIIDLVSYKNGRGAVVRGGDVWIQNSKFTDNDVAVIMNSDDLLPYDAGSHQELTGSIVVATDNLNDPEWQARSYPSIGVQLRGGPVLIEKNHFHGYTSAGGREAYALGFYPLNPGQFGSTTTIGVNTINETTRPVYFGRTDPSSIHGSYDADGDYFQIFSDPNGVLTGWQNSYAVRLDNLLIRGDNCISQIPANAAACVGNEYGQLFVKANTKMATLTIQYASAPNNPVVLNGANKDNTAEYSDSTQYQATVIPNRNYRISFSEQTAPSWIELSVHNFQQQRYVTVGIEYPGTAPTFDVQYIEWKQMEDQIVRQESLTAGSSIGDVNNDADGFTYFWDGSLLWVKLVNHYAINGYNYCAAEGCQIIRVTTN